MTTSFQPQDENGNIQVSGEVTASTPPLTYNPLTVIHILPHLIFHIAEGSQPPLILRARTI